MKRVLLFVLALQTGCATAEINSTGCIRMGAESEHLSDVHLYKAGQPVPGDNLVTATADDPEAQAYAKRSRQHAMASIVLGAIGIALTVVGVSITADGGKGDGATELGIGIPFAAVGVGSLIAAGIEMKKSANRGRRAVSLYDEHHPACR